MKSALVNVTLLYGGVLLSLLTALGLHVSYRRGRVKAFVGSEVPPDLMRVIRCHGNATEWIPGFVVLLGLLELSGVGSFSLHLLGGAFVLGRVLHVIGALGKNPASVVGATFTYVIMSIAGAWALALHFI